MPPYSMTRSLPNTVLPQSESGNRMSPRKRPCHGEWPNPCLWGWDRGALSIRKAATWKMGWIYLSAEGRPWTRWLLQLLQGCGFWMNTKYVFSSWRAMWKQSYLPRRTRPAAEGIGAGSEALCSTWPFLWSLPTLGFDADDLAPLPPPHCPSMP